MYLIGAAHRLKTDAQTLLERAIAASERMVTDAEVLQEILHRYTAINRRDAIGPALRAVLGFIDEVFPVEKSQVLRAGEILQHPVALSAHDALHVAVMERYGVSRIMSLDADFDRWPGITRVSAI